MDPINQSHSIWNKHLFVEVCIGYLSLQDYILVCFPAHHCNNRTEFDCANNGRQCILMSKLCDKKTDCENSEDEAPSICSLDSKNNVLKT